MIKIPESLKQALRDKRVIPFIGAGVSRNVRNKTGNTLFPDWPSLLLNTVEKLRAEGKDPKADRVQGALNDIPPDYLAAAKHAREGLKANWYDYLQKVFKRSRDEVDDESLKVARLCWGLGSNLLITGNYENVLGWACPSSNAPELWKIKSIKEQVDLLKSNATTEFPTVWHLHGHISEVQNLIITPDGYADLYPEDKNKLEQQYAAALSVLHTLLTIRPFLFIGFSMDDRQFELQMKFVDRLYEGTSVKHYILLQKDSAQTFTRRDYLHPVTFETFEELPGILQELADIASDGKAVSAAPKSGATAAKNLFNVPFRSKGTEFIGREGKLEEIRKALQDSNGVSIGQAVGIQGMGGLGKTQLAVEYAHKYKGEYSNGVIWFTADGDMEGQLRSIAVDRIWVNKDDKPENQLILARNELKNLTGALLIFDNVNDYADIESYLPKSDSDAHMLATAREKLPKFESVEILTLTRDASRKLLLETSDRKTESNTDKDALEKILDILDGLPLAIEMAGAYLEDSDTICSWQEYLELLEEKPEAAFDEAYTAGSFTEHDEGVYRTLRISDRLLDKTPYLRTILDTLAWSGPSSMGISLLLAMLGVSGKTEIMGALARAVNLRLLKRETDARSEKYFIHRLLAKVHRAETPLKDRKEWTGECAERLGQWFTEIKDDFTRLADFESELEHLEAWERNAIEDFPEKGVRLIYLRSTPAYHRGQYENAKTWALKAYEEYKERILDNRILLADILSELGNLSSRQKLVREALEYDQEALNIRKEVLGEKHLDYAKSLKNIGNNYSDLGEYKKALEYHQKALEIRNEVLGENHHYYAFSLIGVGNAYSYLGEYRKAFEYHQKGLDIVKELMGESHPDYALSLNSAGVTCSYLGQDRKAFEYMQKALDIRKEVLGEKHPDYTSSLNNIGVAYDNLGDHNKALEYKQKALDVRKEVLGEKHPDYASSLHNIGVTYDNLGDHNKALEYKQKALDIRKEALGEMHPDYALSLNNVGVSYYRLGDHKKSLEYFQKALDIQKEALGEKHPDYAMLLHNISAAYRNLGDNKKAAEYRQKERDILKKLEEDNLD